MKIIDTQIVNEVEIHISELPDSKWGVTNKEIALAFGVTVDALKQHKSRSLVELVENKHFYSVTNSHGGSPLTVWTQRGIVRLGFMLNSTPAIIKFRDWAEDYIVKDSTPQLPTTFLDAIKQLVVTEEARVALELENKAKALQIKQDAPKVQLAEAIEVSVNSINIGSYADNLFAEYNVKIGQTKLFAWMRDNGILVKTSRHKNDPMQMYMDNGYFEVKVGTAVTPKGITETRVTLITGRGQLRLADKIIAHFRK